MHYFDQERRRRVETNADLALAMLEAGIDRLERQLADVALQSEMHLAHVTFAASQARD